MPIKTFKIKWDSGTMLTEYNVKRALKQYFYDEFSVKELLRAPKVALDLVKKKIKNVKYNIRRKKYLKKESRRQK